jgi:cardiolipin synthase A/B
MTVRVAIPIYRVACRVGIDKGRPWSIVEELLLWSITRKPKTTHELSMESSLPRQLVVSTIARLMRFRLVEITFDSGTPAFRASAYGIRELTSGRSLPYFPRRFFRRVSFMISRATGEVFAGKDARPISEQKLKEYQAAGYDVRTVVVTSGGPVMSHEANFARLCGVAARGPDEELATVDDRTATVRSNEFLIVQVYGTRMRGLPESAGPELRRIILQTAALPAGARTLTIAYRGQMESSDNDPQWHPCMISPADLIIGGSAQRHSLAELFGGAHRRVIMHSTFLRTDAFLGLADVFRAACRRGVTFDLFWGAEADESTEERNTLAAVQIARHVQEDPDFNGRLRVHLRSTGSHSKLMMVDQVDGSWLAVVSTCNWLYSDFRGAELSVVIREPSVVADVASAFQRVVSDRGLSDPIASELAVIARNVRRLPPCGTNGRMAVVSGEQHEAILRAASGASQYQFVVGTNKLGSTARTGALMLAEVAAQRHGDVIVLYDRTSGPMKSRHARRMREEGAPKGVRLVETKEHTLHGKFAIWDDDDVIVTSLNWGSASANVDSPLGEIGVHLHGPGIGAAALRQIQALFPELCK